ncbi:unnamed protein product [Pieris macdunnoughi]|uniref:Uncharacterized protein n=1 Tax=Pieris macdunnoughi TaxID=345717 RepID=A0A821W476_9NEOP|nr:unnamed protein product [Pieris macdunnoughi]
MTGLFHKLEYTYSTTGDKIQNQFSIDPKSFWQYVKDHTRPLKRECIVKDGINLTEKESANEFAQFFKSVYSTETPQLDVNAAAAYGTSSARVRLDDFTLREVDTFLFIYNVFSCVISAINGITSTASKMKMQARASLMALAALVALVARVNLNYDNLQRHVLQRFVEEAV